MWKAVIKWSLLCMLLAYVVVMFVWARAQAAEHTVKGIEIVIDGRSQVSSISPQSVREVLAGYPKPIVGEPRHTVNTLEIADYLRGINSFESVDCLITSLGNLRIKVTPMVPAIRVFDGASSYYVNKDGKRMAALPGFHVDVPVVTGRFGGGLRPEVALPVVRFVERDSLLSNLVSMIKVADASNILLVPRVKGHVINIGDSTRLPEKRRAIETAYRSILPYKGWDAYDTISVKFRGQIVATRRDKTPLHPVPVVDDTDMMEDASAMAAVDSVKPGVLPKQAN